MYRILLGFFLKRSLICPMREKQVGCASSGSYALGISLRYDFLGNLQQKIRVYNLEIWQSRNSLCIIDRNNNIPYVNNNSKNRGFGT